MLDYAGKVLNLKEFLCGDGDGRVHPQIKASVLVRALLTGLFLRAPAYSRVEHLPRGGRKFSDDTLAYFTERACPQALRQGLISALRRAKRNKAFAAAPLIGLAIDGTKLGRFSQPGCELCRAHDGEHPEKGHYHGVCALSVVGAGLTLPIDVEPYGPGDSEYAAGQRLMRRAVEGLGVRFAQYVAGDGNFATAPFLHAAGDAGMHVLARLKDNLPELCAAARARFMNKPAHHVIKEEGRRIELWDADDFEPWDTLRWHSVRVMRYRYEKGDGDIVDAYWLTNLSKALAPTQVLYRCAKSRWEIENQIFNDAKNRYGFAHTPHHHQNSLLIHWLLVFLALLIERLYRLRYLHRGVHAPLSAQRMHDLLWQHQAASFLDTS
jgi:hypothetical protein